MPVFNGIYHETRFRPVAHLSIIAHMYIYITLTCFIKTSAKCNPLPLEKSIINA